MAYAFLISETYPPVPLHPQNDEFSTFKQINQNCHLCNRKYANQNTFHLHLWICCLLFNNINTHTNC